METKGLSPRPFGTAGFILSAVTESTLLMGPLALIALVSYPASIVLRATAWTLIGGRLKRVLFKFTGVAVGFLGGLLYLTLVGERFGLGFLRELLAGALRVPSPIGELGTILVLWAAYSVLEFIAYLGLAGSTRTFMGASINLVGVILAYPLLSISFYHPLILILLVSAVFASIGFYRLKDEVTEASYH